MKIFLVYSGNNGDSGRLICACKTRAKCFQVIGGLNKLFSFENPGADISRDLQTCFNGQNTNWARIDTLPVCE